MRAVVTGKLKFKGAFEEKAAVQKKVLENRITRLQEEKIEEIQRLRGAESGDRKPVEPKVVVHERVAGTGRITTSGTTVSGKDTVFTKELARGDWIFPIDGTTGRSSQTKVRVSMVLSDRSLILEAALPRDVITFSQFDIQKQDTIEAGEEEIEHQFAERLKAQEIGLDTRPVQTVVEIKKKSGMWGYKTERVVMNGDLSREEVIKLRAQHKKDKWC